MKIPQQLTISEHLFEKFCLDNSIRCKKIEERDCPTPDYKIRLGFQNIYVEVKQFDKNDNDKKFIKKFQEDKHAGRWESTDKRIRKKIDEARRQFQELRKENCPNLLVVYDNTSLGIINSDDVKTAMYGDETISFSAQVHNGIVKWFPSRIGFGGNRKVTPKMNTNISAVSVLSKFRDDSLFLSIYHNIYAKKSIKPNLFRGKQVSQYKLSAKIATQFQEWQEI